MFGRAGEGTLLLYSMPWFATSADGCTALLQWKMEQPVMSLSTTQATLLEAGQSTPPPAPDK